MFFEGCSSPVSKNAIYDLYCSYFTLFLTKLSYQILVTTTKRNVTENLTYPLLEISVGLNIFLASANQAMDIDEAGRKNLSRIALACNMAVNALDDMAYSNNIFAAPTETGKKRREKTRRGENFILKTAVRYSTQTIRLIHLIFFFISVQPWRHGIRYCGVEAVQVRNE
jgi:hypothetical protein